MIIAKTEPTTAIQIGIVGGRLYASRSPVTTADRSLTVIFVCITYFCQTHSLTTQAKIHAAITPSDRRPRKYTPIIPAGARARITMPIIFLVVNSECTCGEVDTVNFVFMTYFASAGFSAAAFALASAAALRLAAFTDALPSL